MRKYETIFITHPDLTDEDRKGLIEKVKGIIESLQGEVLKIEEWGKKKLAYEIRRMSRGDFVLLYFLGTAPMLVELERNLRLMDGVLKYQTVRLDEKAEKIAQLLSPEKTSDTEEKRESPTEEAKPDESTQEGGMSEKEAQEEPSVKTDTPGEPGEDVEEGVRS
jgi:small subunit ribosomal protein S6